MPTTHQNKWYKKPKQRQSNVGKYQWTENKRKQHGLKYKQLAINVNGVENNKINGKSRWKNVIKM